MKTLFAVLALAASLEGSSIVYISALGQSLSKGLCVSGGSNPCTFVPPSSAQYGTNRASNPILGSNPGTSFVTLTGAHMLNDEFPGIEAVNQMTYESGGTFVGVLDGNDTSSGAAYSVIKKGTANYTAWHAALGNAPTSAAAAGYTWGGCGAALVVHGEADFSGFGISNAAQYDAHLTEWQSDMETDCGVAHPFFVSQLSTYIISGTTTRGAPTTSGGVRGVPLGQLDAARDQPGKIYLVGPKYQWQAKQYMSQIPHMTEQGYLRVGEQAGHAMKTVLVDGKYWTGVQPRALSISGSTITARYWVQEGALVFDTTLLPDRITTSGTDFLVWHGFEVVDGSGNPVLISGGGSNNVSAGGSISGDTITIHLASTPSGTPRLRYAWTNPHDASTNDIAWGNLRDSATATGRVSGERLYSWAAHSDDPIPYTSPVYVQDVVPTLSSLTTSASNLASSASAIITATLSSPAGGGGQTVAITYSSVSGLSSHPATITVSSGQTTGTMTITAGALSSNSIVAVTGDGSKTVNVALNKAYSPSYPIKLCLTPPAASGTCTDTSFLKQTPTFIDRYLTVQTNASTSLKDPTTAQYPHFGATVGGANNYYLLWPDVSIVSAGSTINSATLKLKTNTWFTMGDLMAVRRVTDPDSLAGGCASCSVTGWSTLGTADTILSSTGADSAFRNHTGSGTGTKWRTSDASSDVDQIRNSLATADDTQTVSTQLHVYTWNVASSLTAWVGGAVKQGWGIYTTNTNANGSVYPVHNTNTMTELDIQFTPPGGSDAAPPTTITNLGVSCIVAACTLSWTAPSDNVGVAAYDIRYSTAPITDAVFLTATPMSGLGLVVPTPGTPGATDTAAFTAPEAITLYFAIRSRDALVNWSPASNSPSLVTANPRGIGLTRPRMFWQSPDAFMPTLTRAQALVAKATNSGCTLSGCATAAANFATMRGLLDSANGMNCARSGAATTSCARGLIVGTDLMTVTLAMEAAEVYLVLRQTDLASANVYADAVVGSMTSPVSTSLLGYTGWGTAAAVDNAAGQAGLEAMALGLLYDTLHERIVERDAGPDPGLKAALLAKMHLSFNALNETNYVSKVRDSGFHNYSIPWWSGKTMLALAAYGDDPDAGTWMAQAAGLMGIDAGGWQWNPTGYSNGGTPEKFTFNLQKDIVELTDGTANWEGPEYWKNAISPAIWSLDAFDTATNKALDLFNPSTGLFGSLYKAGLWRVYMNRADNRYPGTGDAHDKTASGKDQVTLAPLEYLFSTFVENGLKPGEYIKTFLDNAASGAPWGVGGAGSDGFAWKLLYYDFGGVTAKPYSDLPLSRRFGKDVILRSGWGIDDTFMTFIAGLGGQYHAHSDQGNFTIFRSNNLAMQGGIYSVSTYPYYNAYFRRSVAANVPLVYKAGECWKDNQNVCGISTNSFAVTNDGGQRWMSRRFNPPFSAGFAANVYQINRLWTATALTHVAPFYDEQFFFGWPAFRTYSWIDHVQADLTKAYTYAYSGQGDNTDIRVAPDPDSARREVDFIHDVDNFIAIFDKVVAADASYAKSWLLHSPNVPKVNTGSTVTPAAGVNTYSGVNYTVTDNGTARMFNTPLLPASSTVRVVGGNNCAPITISSVSSPGAGQPGVFTTSAPHGLVNGEWIASAVGGGAGVWFGSVGISSSDAVNVQTFQVWGVTSTTFKMTKMVGARDVVLDGLNGNPDAAAFAAAFPSGVVIPYHTNCGSEGLVDDYYSNPANKTDYPGLTHNGGMTFPAGVRTNLWNPTNESTAWVTAGITIPRWRYEIKPSTPATTDYFLNVLQPADTGTSTPATASLITATNYYGAKITGSAATYLVMFSTSATPQGSLSYTVTHSGSGKHMISGLAPGLYTVTQDAVQIATPDVGADGSVTFTETGGGTFSLGGNTSVMLTVGPGSLGYVCTAGGIAPSGQTVAIGAINGTLDNWSASKSQAWLTLSPASGSAAGSFTASVSCSGLAPGSYTDTVFVSSTTTNVSNSPMSLPVSLTVYAGPSITTTTLPSGAVGLPYSQTITVSGGQPGGVMSIVSGQLCAGLTLAPVLNPSGTVSGVPLSTGTCSFTARVQDAGGVFFDRALSIQILNASGVGLIPRGVSPRGVLIGH